MQNKKEQFIEECTQTIIDSGDFDVPNIEKVCREHKFYNSFNIDFIDTSIGRIEQHIIEFGNE